MLVLAALAGLIRFDLMASLGFNKSYTWLRRCQTKPRAYSPEMIARVCDAVDTACVFYVKRTFCYQRSAVTTLLLRRRGVPAQMVIGFRPVPVDSHAWVEVDGKVVNDRPQFQKFFRVLDRV
jgi:hypothetical protein